MLAGASPDRTSNRAFLRGVAQLGGFLARTSDGEPGWQTLWKAWTVLMTLLEGYELAQTITSAHRNPGKTQHSGAHGNATGAKRDAGRISGFGLVLSSEHERQIE